MIIVLVMLLALIGVVVRTSEKSSSEAIETSLLLQEYQTRLLAEEGAAVAMRLLANDQDDLADTPFEPWAQGFKVKGLEVRITPVNAKLNLNLIGEGEPGSRMFTALSRVIFDGGETIGPILDLQGWVTATDKMTQAQIQRNAMIYTTLDLPYAPRHGPLACIEELRLIPTWQRVDLGVLGRYFTVGEGAGDKLNINFALPELMRVYIPELDRFVADIVSYRQTRGFQDVSKLLAATGMAVEDERYQAALPYLSVTSRVFEADVLATHSSCRVQKRYILKREESALGMEIKMASQADLSVQMNAD